MPESTHSQPHLVPGTATQLVWHTADQIDQTAFPLTLADAGYIWDNPNTRLSLGFATKRVHHRVEFGVNEYYIKFPVGLSEIDSAFRVVDEVNSAIRIRNVGVYEVPLEEPKFGVTAIQIVSATPVAILSELIIEDNKEITAIASVWRGVTGLTNLQIAAQLGLSSSDFDCFVERFLIDYHSWLKQQGVIFPYWELTVPAQHLFEWDSSGKLTVHIIDLEGAKPANLPMLVA